MRWWWGADRGHISLLPEYPLLERHVTGNKRALGATMQINSPPRIKNLNVNHQISGCNILEVNGEGGG